MSDCRSSVNGDALKGDGERNDENYTLDIDEFDLPPIDQVPSLNEILNQNDDGNDFDVSLEFNDVVLNSVGNGHSNNALAFDDRSDISSIASTSHSAFSRRHSFGNQRIKSSPGPKASKADILRCTKLRGISNQIVSAKERVNAGTPTAMAVCEKYIGVGTAHGLVLVFGSCESQQVLKCCLGSTSNVLESGGVAALDFSTNGAKLLVGFANGWIHLYDVQSAKIVQRLSDAHPPGYAVLHLKFCTTEGNTAALNDSGGSVYELTFGRMISKSSASRCLFSGSRGEVCCIAPLLVPEVYKKQCSHYAEPVLLAMASLTKVIVVRLVPSTRVVFASPLLGRPESAPVLCWQFTSVQLTEKNRIVDPVLTFGRDGVIHLYQLHTSDGEKFRAFAMQKLDFNESSPQSRQLPMILHTQWLSHRYLLVLDAAENLSLFEFGVDGECCLGTADLRHTKLVYGTSAFKALATGGNVSKALACMASKVCYHSFVVLSNQAFVLGVDAIYSISVRSWLDRVDGLVQANDWVGAMRLVLEFYTGKRKLGTGTTSVSNQKNAGDKWRPIVADKGVHLLLDYADVVASERLPLDGKIEDVQEHMKTVVPLFIESCVTLEREDVLYDHVYPRFAEHQVAKAFFLECLDDYIGNNLLTNLPPAIVQDYFSHLEREGLYGSIEASVVRLPVECLDLHQVMTLCRLHNLYDGIIYVFNQALRDFLTPLKEMIFPLVRIVSNGDLLTDEDIRLGNKVLLYISCCLCGQMYPVGQLEPADGKRVATEVCDFICAMQSKEIDAVSKYPFLRALLKFDCREFLNVLSMAFGSHCLDIDEQQLLIDILVQIMVDDTDWAPFQTGALFTFVMRQVVMRAGDIAVTQEHFRQLLKVVLRGKPESIGTSSFEERQQALIEFLHSAKSTDLFDENEMLSLAEKSQYFQVCEILYEKRRQFDKIIQCFARDVFRKEQIFDYVTEMLSTCSTTAEEKTSIKSAFLETLPDVGESNVQRCADVMFCHFMDSLLAVCEKLSNSNCSFLPSLLLSLLEMRNLAGQNGFVDDQVADKRLSYMLCCQLCKTGDIDTLLRVLAGNPDFCTSDVFNVCKEFRATKAVVHILELKGKLDEAFSTIHDDIVEVGKADVVDRSRLESLVSFALEFLKDKCNRLPKEQQESLWFKLLLLLMNFSVEDKSSAFDLKPTIVKVVHSMVHFADASNLLPKLLAHPLFHDGTYAEFHDLIDGILNGYSYDEVLYGKLLSCIYGEIHEASTRLRRLSSAGFFTSAAACQLCDQLLMSTQNQPAIVFDCSHVYHSECLRSKNSFFMNRHSVQEWVCCVCTRKDAQTKSTKGPKIGTVAQVEPKASEEALAPPAASGLSKFDALEELECSGFSNRNPWRSSQQSASNFASPLNLAPPRL